MAKFEVRDCILEIKIPMKQYKYLAKKSIAMGLDKDNVNHVVRMIEMIIDESVRQDKEANTRY